MGEIVQLAERRARQTPMRCAHCHKPLGASETEWRKHSLLEHAQHGYSVTPIKPTEPRTS